MKLYLFFWFLAALQDNFEEEFSAVYIVFILLEMLVYNPTGFLILLFVFLLTEFVNNPYIGNGDLFFIVLPAILLKSLNGFLIYGILLSIFLLINLNSGRSALLFPSLIAFLLIGIS